MKAILELPEMPKCCGDCVLFGEDWGFKGRATTGQCWVTNAIVATSSRNPYCPLKIEEDNDD
jgi:hypothetical protein